ncbi:MAG: hypothetical protein M3461_24075 [Pseudomonadota bacterium]|nr:hypothetical protein [Pseudomonadota bacterium]
MEPNIATLTLEAERLVNREQGAGQLCVRLYVYSAALGDPRFLVLDAELQPNSPPT